MARQPIEIDRDKLHVATRYDYGRDNVLAIALEKVAPDQRKVLAEDADRQASQRRTVTKP